MSFFFRVYFSFLLHFFPFFVNFLNSSFTTFPSTQVCFCDLLQLCAPHLEFVYSFVLHSYNQGWLATQTFFFNLKKNFFFVLASPALVVGMLDNEYTDAQVWDARGLFKSLDPAPCGAVPAYLTQCSSSSLPQPVLQFWYLIQCCSSSLPHPVLQFSQCTSSSAAVPVYLIQCCSSGLPHPVLQFRSTSSSASDPVYLIQCSGSMQSASPVQKTLISL